VAVVDSTELADLDVYVFAETLKPEDRRALADSPRPVVAVLAKADLTGFGGQGPIAAAAAHCRRLRELTGVPVYPLAGLAAAAALDDTVDDEMLDALRALTADPADLGSTDRFIDRAHRLPHPVRERLLARLDLFGIAHGVLAVRAGADRAGVQQALRRVSALDGLLTGIRAAAAPVRYQRLIAAHAGALPASEDAVVARMAAAIDVVRAAGLTVADLEDLADMEGDATASAWLRRAIAWQRYSRGPVSRLHQRCGADIARGALRLWERAGGVAESLEPTE
jgi:hypothetical protein